MEVLSGIYSYPHAEEKTKNLAQIMPQGIFTTVAELYLKVREKKTRARMKNHLNPVPYGKESLGTVIVPKLRGLVKTQLTLSKAEQGESPH